VAAVEYIDLTERRGSKENVAKTPTIRSTGGLATSGTSSNPIRFFGEIVSELRKVNWPNRQEAWRLTTLVIVIAIVIGAALGLIDMGFSRVFAIVAGN